MGMMICSAFWSCSGCRRTLSNPVEKMRILFIFLTALIVSACQGDDGLKSGEHGQVAYAHTERILSFGPRPPESQALKDVLGYVGAELKKAGWEVKAQSFERET